MMRVTQQNARSRAIGAGVGTLMGLGWLMFSLTFLPKAAGLIAGGFGLGMAAFLLRKSRQAVAASRRLPAPTGEEQTAHRQAWKWFWLNFLLEIVLLNVAINLLNKPELRIYWIPAISLVVGLHFLPMAGFFRAPAYWFCGGVMIALAAVASLALWQGNFAAPPLVTAAEAIANACILWATAAWGLHAFASSSLRVEPDSTQP